MDEILDRYKSIVLWQRLAVLALLALLPAIYVWWFDGEEIRAEIQTEEQAQVTAKADFDKAKNKRSRLPELEEKLAFTQEQLEVARKNLPDRFNIDEVLQKTAAIAREVGVSMVLFEPGDERAGAGGTQVRELPIRTSINGRFSQVVAFLDRVTHLETLIFARDIELTGQAEADEEENGDGNEDGQAAGGEEPSEFEIARDARENMRVQAVFNMILFRTPDV